MPNLNFRRFSKPSALKQMAPESLLELLDPYREYFQTRSLVLPFKGSASAINYVALATVLMSPDESLPLDLATGLYFIHEMSTPEGMDALQSLDEPSPALLELVPEMAPADVALRFWLRDPAALERKHTELHYLVSPRSFESFSTRRWPLPMLTNPSEEKLRELEKALSQWFSSKRRGPSSRVLIFDRGKHVWILIRHGEPLKREGSVDGEESGSVFYRPEKWDVLIYLRKTGELRVNAGSKGELELYRKAIGGHLFNDEETFVSADLYTLEPLREKGRAALVCSDIEGLEMIVLKEIWYFWRGSTFETEIRKAKDIFEALEKSAREMPRKVPITKAKFAVKFAGQTRTRTVTIQARRTQFTRDDDSLLVEEWLQKRGFVLPRKDAENAA